MANSHSSDFELFCQNSLFAGISTEELKLLFSISKEITLAPGDTLIKENEEANDLFIIIKGIFKVSKHDPEGKTHYIISTMSPGDIVGELSFLDRAIRSATVTAETAAVVRGISFDALEQFVNKSVEYSRIYIHLSKNISQRLRSTSNVALDALKNEVRETKTRVSMGLFLVYIIAVLCLFAYALSGLQQLLSEVQNTTFIALPLTLIIGAALLLMMKFSSLSWKNFGVSLSNWQQAVFEGLVFPIPICGFGIFVKWLCILFVPAFAGRPIFDPFAIIPNPAEKTIYYWLAFNLFYCLIMVPIQELLTRGALQGLLEYFLTGRHKILISILMSNLMFSTVHLFLPTYFSLIVFFGGLYMGWIYSRTHNLISSFLAHSIMGTWVLSVLGPVFNS